MRILSVSNCPALEHLGSGYVIANFARGLRARGHEVDLLEPDDYELCRFLRPRAMSYRQALGMLFATERALRRKTYDLIEFWGAEAWLATRWLARRPPAQRPLIVQHTNGPEPRYNRMLRDLGILKLKRGQSWYARKLLPQAFQHADAIVTVSQYDLDWLRDNELPRSGRRLAVEVPLPECFIGRLFAPHSTAVIGFCGNWLPRKGIDLIVADITDVLRTFPAWRFVILGTDLSDDARTRFPVDVQARVEVVPMIKDKEALARIYEEIEIFVLPSHVESFGVAVAEAMACGCAVVTTPVGFAASLTGGEHAVILQKAESPQLYHAVARLIENPELRRRLGEAARCHVQSLRWKNATRTLADTYEDWFENQRRALEGEPIPQMSTFPGALRRHG
jgi:glycosyltransferase involved in cell wall biosynthesis